MSTSPENREDDQLASLLRAAELDTALPDRALLDRLRDQSTAAFVSSSSQTTIHRKKGRLMFRMVQGLAAAVVAVVLISSGMHVWQRRSEPTLKEVLLASVSNDSSHFVFSELGTQSQDVWVSGGTRYRIETSPGNYIIRQGAEAWEVNEKANTAVAKAIDHPIHGTPAGDFLGLLDIAPNEDVTKLLKSRPVDYVDHDGIDCLVYQGSVGFRKGSNTVRALVDASTKRVVTVELGSGLTALRITAVSYDEPSSRDKFQLKDTLTEDGRVGKVADSQGIVTLKPVMGGRWTPVQNGLILKPGDWVRTDSRGANAVALKLMKATGVIVGPGSIVEVTMPDQLKVLEGELELNVPDKAKVEVTGPDGQKLAVTGKKHFRVDRQQLVAVATEPKWLKGFKGTTADESIGSLIAKVDGREVPLYVGYHKVAVDIRDQIARTVIEESFVNSTDFQLEGVFHFPLPQDASISGFGMWIGNELVEADVVEKQRAREIYEQILRERRDPGLLEWSGGNIFKARVFPIFPHSEKRIKITYTQVLPLKGGRYRYSYGLQSELLKQHPLRELAIDVKLNSAVPLKSVTCPTHPTRNDKTNHSGHVEFTAQQYTPTRDFEVVVEIDGRANEVVVIPHRRGDDGYFMLQLLPPNGNGNWERELLTDGEPVNILLLADTSASMDKSQRLIQDAFLGALFAALTPKDTFNLAACDVNCDWAFERPVSADPKSIAAARDFLARRVSLGWTDLDKAFASAFQMSGPKTQVIYLGDGIVTTGDGDSQAFVKRLQRLNQARRTGEGEAPAEPAPWERRPPKDFTCHTVALGNSFEPAVLKGIAALGGGSLRRVTGEQGPAAVARELLAEISQPALRDLRVEFKGLRTARVYPEVLPNLPPGTQQILLGRYLPEGRDQAGEVIVTGYQGAKPLRFSTAVSLKDAEQGNSFIPRLWARMHLDRLLEQGQSGAVKDEVIALSEEFNIMTPYTSFLVLETDADRERFKVQRRFRMRDGEKFFAEGKANANYELTQKQMQKAGNWRVGLRASVLRQFGAMGRNLQVFQPQRWSGDTGWAYGMEPGMGGNEYLSVNGRWGMPDRFGRDLSVEILGDRVGSLIDNSGSMMYAKDANILGLDLDVDPLSSSTVIGHGIARFREEGESDLRERFDMDDKQGSGALRILDEDELANRPMATTPADASARFLAGFDPYPGGPGASMGLEAAPFGRASRDIYDAEMGEVLMRGRGLGGRAGAGYPGYYYQQYTQWLDTLFPALPAAPGKLTPVKSKWPAEAQALAKSLLRTEKLTKMQGGIDLRRTTESFDPRWQEVTSRSYNREMYTPTSWLTRSRGDWSQAITHWCDGKVYGVFGHAFLLGRQRASVAEDLRPPFGLGDYSLHSLEENFSMHVPTLKEAGKDRTLLVLTFPPDPKQETRILIDTARHVIISVESLREGKTTWTTKFDDFVEVAGSWWARRVEHFDEKNQRTSTSTQTLQALSAEEFNKQVAAELAARATVQFIPQPMPKLDAAKKAHATNKATFEDELALLLHFARTQQWTRVYEHLDAAEKLATSKPGVRWLRPSLQQVSRRHEDLKKRILEEAPRVNGMVVKTPDGPEAQADIFLAQHLINLASGTLHGQEFLDLVEKLQPVYHRQPQHLHAAKAWQQLRVNAVQQMGRTDEARLMLKQLAADYPRDVNVHTQYAQALANTGDYEGAYAWLRRVLVPESKWLPHEEDQLRNLFASYLAQEGRYADLVAWLDEWVKRNPESQSAYQQYLSALIRANQEDRANQLIAEWFKEGQQPGPLATAAGYRLQAAVTQALGQGYHLHTNIVEARWHKPLGDAAIFLARHETHSQIAQQIMSHHAFHNTDEVRRVRKAVQGIFAAELDKLTPQTIRLFTQWLLPNDPAVPAEFWKQVTDGLAKRWAAEKDEHKKHELGETLVGIFSARAQTPELLAFLRSEMRDGPKQFRPHYVNQLFNTLLVQPWSAEFENEAFALLAQLTDAEDAIQRLAVQIQALHRLDDAMLASRTAARLKEIKEQEKLSRTDLAKQRADKRKLARQEFADRLKQEIAKHPKELARWVRVEWLYFETLTERDMKAIAAACWEVLGEKPPVALEVEPESIKPEAILDELHRERHLAIVTHLATRQGADAALVKQLLTFVDAGIAGEKDGEAWKLFKYRMLVALDRPKDLEQSLQAWLKAAVGRDASEVGQTARWRVSLAYLLAELGRIDEAIKLFEAAEKADELGPTAYRALADWYLVVDRRDKRDESLKNVFKMAEEHVLANLIYRKLSPWQRGDGHLPAELDEDVLRLFAALFDKSGHPANYLGYLQQFYQACHDFRLLAVMVDGVVGHTATKVYPFLQGMTGVLAEVRDEATVDEIMAQIEKTRRAAGLNPAVRAVDHRALDLLTLLVRRRAAELKNQPGPHLEAALAAMQRAFKREWSDGEPRLMADLLHGLGNITQPALAKEQLAELEQLYRAAKAGSFDRLHIGHRQAQTIHNYRRTAEAIDLLEPVLKEFQNANQGILPASANEAISTLVYCHTALGHYARGEKLLLEQLAHPVHEQQKLWLTQQLLEHYHHALGVGAEVSLGKGAQLYKALEAKLLEQLKTGDQNHRFAMFRQLTSVYRTVHLRGIANVSGDVRVFAFKIVPEFIQRQTNNYDNIITTVSQLVHDLLSPRDGIAFLLDRIDAEPRWFHLNNQDGWSRHGGNLAHWRSEAKNLGDLEPRLLKLVLAELRRDLETRSARNRVMYDRHGTSWYWAEKEAEFVKTAEAVLAERKQSGPAVQYIAEYFYHSLAKYDRAIAILFEAHGAKRLEETGIAQLIRYLHERDRYAESIALLEPLVETKPEALHYRVQLMRAYFKTKQPTKLLALLKETDAFFHQKDRWNEGVLASLAASTLDNELYTQSIAYYDELIPLHERTQPNRGIGNGTLSQYYGNAAKAYAGVKNTAKAIDMASGAVISWGPQQQQRAQALQTLVQVMAAAADLDAYVAKRDQDTKDTPDSPIIRKALGKAYASKAQPAQAAVQFKIAVELQGNDSETHQLLIASYDSLGDKEAAIRQLIDLIDLSRREMGHYKDLGNRLAKLDRPAEAERAFTSAVEMLSTESESHTLLAEIRQEQNRWPAAIEQWEQVARIRALEPTGLLNLAKAQIHEKSWEPARNTVKKLQRGWPQRFGDVGKEVRELEKQIEGGRK